MTTELPPPQQGPRTGIVRPAETVGVTSADGHARDILGAFPSTELSYVGAPRGQMDGIPLTFARTLHVAARGDRILVGTSDGYRIAVYDLNGGLARVVRQRRTPVPVAEEDYERGLLPAHRAGGARRAQLEPHLEQMKYHTTLPAFGADAPLPSFRITRSGSFWVREYTPRWIEGSTWQLFDTEGIFKGRLELPPRFDVLDMGDDWVLARAFDDLDVERVVLHRIERMPAPR